MTGDSEHRALLVRRLVQLRKAVERGTASSEQRVLLAKAARALADGSLYDDEALQGRLLYWTLLDVHDVNKDLRV